MSEIHIDALHKRFADGTVAVHDFTMTIRDGELFVLLGPSGCGKTTTLRCIAGLEHQTSGDIRIGDRLVNGLRPSERDIAMVFQFYALYPHLSVEGNIAFPLRAAGVAEKEVRERVAEAARMLRLEPFLGRRPSRLSGGEQQRVALARAMIRRPEAFLMDEPLTNLDAELRVDMRTEIRHLQQRLGATMVHVTHDQVEAMALADRICIMSQGRIEQVGSPLEVYRRPATLFAARFIGSPPMNLFPVAVADGHLAGPAGLKLRVPDGVERGADLIAGVRPEGLRLVPAGGDDALSGQVVSREALGDETIYVVDTDGVRLHVRMPPTTRYGEEERVGVVLGEGYTPVYDAGSGQAVSA